MIKRPDALGTDLKLETTEDVDLALHEMSWLTQYQRTVEADAATRMEAIKKQADAKLVCDIAGQQVTIRARWDALQAAVFAWCKKGLAKALPANKKSLKLAHGELKTRSLQAAVVMLEGKKPGDAAAAIARQGGLLAQLEKLLKTEVHGVPLGQLVAIDCSLNKDGIKAHWDAEHRPELHGFLRSLAISVEAGQEQVTIAPADLQVTADAA